MTVQSTPRVGFRDRDRKLKARRKVKGKRGGTKGSKCNLEKGNLRIILVKRICGEFIPMYDWR